MTFNHSAPNGMKTLLATCYSLQSPVFEMWTMSPEAYLKPSRNSNMKVFVNVVNGLQQLTIFAKIP